MTQRLTPEREARIRAHAEGVVKAHAFWGGEPDEAVLVVRELLAEIDALRAELAGAEERGRTAAVSEMLARVDSQGPAVVGRIIEQAEERGAARERAATVTYLRTTPAYWALGDTPWRSAARNIERGDHVPTGTTADGGAPASKPA